MIGIYFSGTGNSKYTAELFCKEYDKESCVYSIEDAEALMAIAEADFIIIAYPEINEEKSLAVLTLKRCRISDYYKNVIREMFTEIKEKNIENLAIDLRGNGGGDTYVVNELFKYLPIDTYYQVDDFRKIRWNYLTFDFSQGGKTKNKRNTELEFDGKVYVLTDEGSFSAAMVFTEMIVDNGIGKVIGESPAESCNFCGEITQFYFEDIGMWLSVSTDYNTRIDPSKGDYIEPDYPCAGEEVIETLYDIVGDNK